jgi:hypothetical protein
MIVYDPLPGQKLVHATRPHEFIQGGGWGGAAEIYSCFGGTKSGLLSASSMRTRGLADSVQAMGLGRGGEIRQKVYPDPHGLEVWSKMPTAVELLYIVSSVDFRQITGYDAPPTPVTHEKYQMLGLPWFGLHDQGIGDSKGSDIFEKLKPVGKGKAGPKEGPKEQAEEATPANPLDKLKGQ